MPTLQCQSPVTNDDIVPRPVHLRPIHLIYQCTSWVVKDFPFLSLVWLCLVDNEAMPGVLFPPGLAQGVVCLQMQNNWLNPCMFYSTEQCPCLSWPNLSWFQFSLSVSFLLVPQAHSFDSHIQIIHILSSFIYLLLLYSLWLVTKTAVGLINHLNPVRLT